MVTGDEIDTLEFEELKGMEGIKEAELDVEGTTIRVAASSGLGNARKLLEMIGSGKSH